MAANNTPSPEDVAVTDAAQRAAATLAAFDAFQRGDEPLARQIDAVLEACDRPGRYLLEFRQDGEGNVLAAVACGNPATATDRGVLVPGIESGADDMVALAERADSLRVLADAQRTADRRQGATCLMVWVGYRSPRLADSFDRNGSPASYLPAVSGAARLAEFCQKWMPDGKGTVVGHSYGSLVAASAISEHGDPGGVPVCARLVAAGSPGFGSGYRAPEGLDVYVAEASADPVAGLGWFGGDPGALAGARPLHTGRTERTGRVWGHTSYFVDGTTSQWNIAAVVGGNRGSVIPAPAKSGVKKAAVSASKPLKSLIGALARRYHQAEAW